MKPRLLSEIESELLNCVWVVESRAAYAELFTAGIAGRGVTGRRPFDGLALDRVCALPNGQFEFARNLSDQFGHVEALIIPARDEAGDLADLIALHMPSGRLRTWRGRAALLGADNIFPRGLVPLEVHATAADWLRAGRAGVFVIDATRAASLLREAEPLAVRNPKFGFELERLLTSAPPRIVVATEARRAAA